MINLLIEKKFGKKTITFLELYKKTKVDLIITGTCLNKQRLRYFNYKNTPDMNVNLALRITYSVPFVFDKIYFENNVYVDGGLLNNFPLDYFKKSIKNTIGITLRDKIEINNLENLDNYILSLIYVSSQSYHNYILEKYKENIIIINLDIQIFDINISKDKFNDLIEIGYNSIKKFLSNYIYNE